MEFVRAGSRNILETIIESCLKLFLTAVQASSAIFYLIFRKKKISKMLEDFKRIKDLVNLVYLNDNPKAISGQLQQLDILVYQFYTDFDNVDLNIHLRNIRLINATITETTSKNVRLYKLNQILRQLEEIESLIPTLRNVYNKITSTPKDSTENVAIDKNYDYEYDFDEDSEEDRYRRRSYKSRKKNHRNYDMSIENQIVWIFLSFKI